MTDTAEIQTHQWLTVCESSDVLNMLGVRALVNNEQVAIFRVRDKLFCLDCFDPFSKAAVLSRGIVGDLQGQLVVASPIYKQHFNLETGQCLEDQNVKLKTYAIREQGGKVQVLA